MSETPYAGKPFAAFKEEGPKPARVTFPVRAASTVKSVDVSVTWWFDSDRLVGHAEGRWTSPAISHLEWTVPAEFVVTEVNSRNLVAWSQFGGRVQVWLEHAVADPVVSWHLNREIKATNRSDINLPAIKFPAAQAVTRQTRVRPLNGWSLAFADTKQNQGGIGASTRLNLRGKGRSGFASSRFPPPENPDSTYEPCCESTSTSIGQRPQSFRSHLFQRIVPMP